MDLLAAVMICSVLTRPRAGMDGGRGGATCGQLRRRPVHDWGVLPDAADDAPA
jgi:hypothetical protein